MGQGHTKARGQGQAGLSGRGTRPLDPVQGSGLYSLGVSLGLLPESGWGSALAVADFKHRYGLVNSCFLGY